MKKPPYNKNPNNRSDGNRSANNKLGRNYQPQKPRFCPDVARDAAAKLIILVLDDHKTLDEAMVQTAEFSELKGRDRAFAAAVAKETLRYIGQADILINTYLQKPISETAAYVRALLRTAVGQFLANIAPPHAIIDRAVALAKSNKNTFKLSGLANAVLRKIFQNERNPEIDDIDLLPINWRNRYIANYGVEKTRLIAGSLKTPAPIDLTLKPNLTGEIREQIKTDFDGEYINTNTLRIKSLPESFTEIESWKNGDLWVQDLAASLPAIILNPAKGAEIADMCSAPGGKTLQLASMGAKVTAIDLNKDRLKLVAQNIARTNLNAKLLEGDAKTLISENEYDAILLDAPCSATGTLRRNMETLWIKTPYDLPKLIEIQCELIRAAAKGLKTGGKLVYAVCSIEPEEGDMAYAAALEAGLKPFPINADEILGLTDAIEERGTVRLLPYMMPDKGGLDGFFIARFEK